MLKPEIITTENTGNKTILTCAGENPDALLEYGVTAQTLTEGSALLNTFKAEMQHLLLSKTDQKQFTVQLEQQLKTTDAELSAVDAMVETMHKSDPVMYRLYWNARTKRKTGAGKLSAKVKVFDSVTNIPLNGARMSIVRTDSTKSRTSGGSELVKNVKITSAGGEYQLKSMPTGSYLFKVTYAGYTDQEVVVYINEGVLTRVEMPLTKIA
jgi:hypothetical protein